MPKMLLFVRPSEGGGGGGGGGADPYGENVSLLLHMNGANGSTTFTDSSLNNFSITANGNAQISTAQAKYGGAAGYFDGFGDYIRAIDLNAFNFGSQDFTVECWIRPNSNPGPGSGLGTLISTGHPDADDAQGIYLGITSTRTLFWLYSTGGSWVTPSGSQPGTIISDSTWTHIAYVRSGNTGYLFVGGQVISSGSITGSLTNTGNNIVVGGRFAAAVQDYAGYIDDVRVTKGVARYTSNFTPPAAQFPDPVVPPDPYGADVSLLLHMNGANGSTTFTDSSLNNFTVTRFGDAQISTTQSKYGGAAGYFDGSGDRITIGSNVAFSFGSSNFTIEMWVFPQAQVNGVPRLIGNLIGGWTTNNWTIAAKTTSSDKYSLYVHSYSPSTPLLTPSVVPSDNQWTHLAYVRNGSNWTVFVNGVSVGTNSWSGSVDAYAMPLTIGGSGEGSEFYTGYIDDLRITKGVARYTSNFTPPTAQFPDPESSAWTPAQASPAVWLDASDASTVVNNGTTLTWLDKSGNGHHFSNNVGNAPVYTGTRNGLNVLRFDNSPCCSPASNRVLENTSYTNSGNSIHLFSVHTNLPAPGRTQYGRVFSFWQNGSTYDYDNLQGFLMTYGVTSGISLFRNNSNICSTAAISNTWCLVDGRRNGTTCDISLNGNSYVNGSTNSANFGINRSRIGNNRDLPGGNDSGLDGSVAEQIIFSTLPNQATIEKLQGYLAHKWGLASSLPSGHPYKNSPP